MFMAKTFLRPERADRKTMVWRLAQLGRSSSPSKWVSWT